MSGIALSNDMTLDVVIDLNIFAWLTCAYGEQSEQRPERTHGDRPRRRPEVHWFNSTSDHRQCEADQH